MSERDTRRTVDTFDTDDAPEGTVHVYDSDDDVVDENRVDHVPGGGVRTYDKPDRAAGPLSGWMAGLLVLVLVLLVGAVLWAAFF